MDEITIKRDYRLQTTIILLMLSLMFIGGGAYYHYLYPPVVLKRAAQEALDDFTSGIESKDRAKVSAALSQLLTDDAHIDLNVYFYSISQLDGGKPITEQFDKTAFIRFIDNVLYPMDDYDYHATVDQFSLAPDRQSAAVTFSSSEWADGNSYFGGVAMKMRFSSDTSCKGEVVFENNKAQLRQAKCRTDLRSFPKNEQENNPETLQHLLQ